MINTTSKVNHGVCATRITVSNGISYTQFNCVHKYKAPVYLLLCTEMTVAQVELFNHPSIMDAVYEVYSRDEYDISSQHLSDSGRAIAIGLALCMKAEGALENDDKDLALHLLRAGEWVQSAFIAIGDVPFIREDGTLPYTNSYVRDTL